MRKRPWYLVAALIAAWVFGAGAISDGCDGISFYRANRTSFVGTVQDRTEAADCDAVAAITERYFGVMDVAKPRVFPLAVASLLLGAAMWGLAAGAMVGRGGARSTLLQVISVHGAVVVLAYVLTPDVRQAMTTAQIELAALQPEPAAAAMRAARQTATKYLSLVPLVATSLHLAGYGLVLLALTRRRAREFFEAGGAARSET